MLDLNKGLRLVKNSHRTWNSKSECFSSALHCYATPKFVYAKSSWANLDIRCPALRLISNRRFGVLSSCQMSPSQLSL